MEKIVLYHGTSDYAWRGIQKLQRIGVTYQEYIDLAWNILQAMNVPHDECLDYLVNRDREIQEMQGVSFFQTTADRNIGYWEFLGRALGENYGTFLRETIKYAARVTKTTPYHQHLHRFFPQNCYPVVLEVVVTRDVIANPHHIGQKYDIELYTRSPTVTPLSMRCISPQGVG